MPAIVYTRVSTKHQADSGLGLKAQADACHRWAKDNSVGVGGAYEDAGVSGAVGVASRPALLHAITALSKGDVLLVAKRDRLGRDPIVIAMIERMTAKAGARIISVAGEGTDDDGPTSVLMRRMVDAFAEYERLIIGARTKAALQAKRDRGERVGTVPYGYALKSDGLHLREEQAEQHIINRAKALRAQGLSLRGVGAELEREGLHPRSGGAWYAAQVRRLVA